jgi:hybrid polyketide synthase/nonribosomal peptide synthetase ACE1
MSCHNEPIAVIGTGCRFPGNATTIAKLWELLSQPRDLSTEIPLSRFNSQGFYHPNGSHHGTSNVQKSYFLEEDVRQFDSQFFNISTAEAESMDPQQRKLLEVVFEAIESANLTMEQLRGTPTAVYVGLMCDGYSGLIFSDMESVPTYGATGAARSILSNRISYFFDWTGPSMTIDSACSSSLVAVHQAVQTLRNRECSVALAAGVNLTLSPRMFIAESKLRMLSPNGRCRMWDEGGDGYARGEGIAAVMLKRLSDAIADGDHIECIIRETHVNQSGRSTGLTVPNPVAQVNLIRQTYAKAGLDLSRQADRPQYFQAHGTGTKVGDLSEVTAIHNVFFSSLGESLLDTLYVGSIKTVIGHSEGAAGLAGLFEASLAIQHGVIPANLHFKTLNPQLQPFYQNLEVPTGAVQWPTTNGGPRRASVNSFGFGGTNAHVILESYSPNVTKIQPSDVASCVTLPFTFSAASERSLASLLSNYSSHLKVKPDIDLNALAWTLLRRKSVFTHKISFSAITLASLCSKIDMELELKAKATCRIVASRSTSKPKRILGVFTGQGAQWAAMGADLIAASSLARETIHVLEEALATLPLEHRPKWSLSAELSAPLSTSRVAEAALSQPLCTAIQIVFVEHLLHAGVRFSAIVGHSSGEIAAAYSAGFISAGAAIKVAYYRGFYAKLAGAGKAGAMLVVGTSMAEAEELCQSPTFEDRLVVAASNSTTSITLSGDADAISEAKEYYDGKDIFARILKVDTAYHSHHMIPCGDPYLQSLMDCDIQIQQPSTDACIWYSSVSDGEQMEAYESLKGTYWRDNMLKPVLFSQAMTQSCATGSYDFVLEIGPHPALKGPASQILNEYSGVKRSTPYSGLLARGQSGMESFADALGSLWTHFGSTSFDAEAYDRLFNKTPTCIALKGLPTYPWDHERALWYESRGSRETRLRQDPPHELLGIQTTDWAEGEYRWRNYLRLNELPWLNGHQIQGQTILPAAASVVMALEASKAMAGGRSICLIKIQDLKIQQSISIKDDTSGVEVLFVTQELSSNSQKESLNLEFSCHACLNKYTGSFVLVTSGRMTLHFGNHSSNILPRRPQKQISDLRVVDVESFYDSLDEVGYGYTGLFRGISFLQQKIDTSTGLVTNASYKNPESTLMMHPGTMDAAIQSLFACLGTPGDGSLWALHVPVSIRNIRFNPYMYSKTGCSGGQDIIFHASLVGSASETLRGNVNFYDSEGQNAILQLEGIEVKPLMPATEADDRLLFHELVWGGAEPDAALVYRKTPFSEAEIRKAETLEMLCLYYLHRLDESVTEADRERCNWHGRCILNYASHVLNETRAGRHPSCKPEWLLHSQDEIYRMSDASVHPDILSPALLILHRYDSDVDCRLVHTVGLKLIPFIRDEDTALEHMRKDGLLDSYYQHSELLEYNEYAGRIAAQVAFRYPLMKVLEIGNSTPHLYIAPK